MTELQLLTNSRRNSFGSCHRKHYYEYELCVRPISDADSLRFGSLVHYGLEAWFLNIWQGAELALREAQAAILAHTAKEKADAFSQATALVMLEAYSNRWQSSGFEVLAVEQHFEIPLVNPDTNGVSRTFRLAGKIDAIVKLPDGRVVIVEHKTSGEDIGPDARYWTKLAIDGQVSGYYMGAKALGYEVEGCVYDVLRKPTIRPYKATPVEARKYTKEGKLYANQRENDETVEEWTERLRADITGHDDKFFRRLEVPRLDADLVDYLSDMWAVAREIADAQNSGRWPKNPRSCDIYSGCPFFEVCAGRESIENPHRFQKTVIHRELVIEGAA